VGPGQRCHCPSCFVLDCFPHQQTEDGTDYKDDDDD
jgi:hypothetical protein